MLASPSFRPDWRLVAAAPAPANPPQPPPQLFPFFLLLIVLYYNFFQQWYNLKFNQNYLKESDSIRERVKKKLRTKFPKKVSKNFLREKGGHPLPHLQDRNPNFLPKKLFLCLKNTAFGPIFNRFFLNGKGGYPLPPIMESASAAGYKVNGKS